MNISENGLLLPKDILELSRSRLRKIITLGNYLECRTQRACFDPDSDSDADPLSDSAKEEDWDSDVEWLG